MASPALQPPLPPPLPPHLPPPSPSSSTTTAAWNKYIPKFQEAFVTEAQNTPVEKNKKIKTSLLDANRTLQISLLIHKLDLNNILKLIDACNPAIDEDTLQKMYKLIPSSSEQNLIRNEKREYLGQSEQVLLKLMAVPYYSKKCSICYYTNSLRSSIVSYLI